MFLGKHEKYSPIESLVALWAGGGFRLATTVTDFDLISVSFWSHRGLIGAALRGYTYRTP